MQRKSRHKTETGQGFQPASGDEGMWRHLLIETGKEESSPPCPSPATSNLLWCPQKPPQTKDRGQKHIGNSPGTQSAGTGGEALERGRWERTSQPEAFKSCKTGT